MPCGGYSNYCNIAGYYTDYAPPFVYQNTTCYKWNNTNECGETYFIDNSGCYRNTPHSNYTNYANVPHENIDFYNGIFGNTPFTNTPFSQTPAWSNYVFSLNWYNHSDHSNNSGSSYYHTDSTPHSDSWTHTNTPFKNTPFYQVPFNNGVWGNVPFYNDPWYNWNNYSNSPFRNFCNHTDTYI